MAIQTETRRPEDQEPEFGRGYFLLFGFGIGIFITVAVGLVVLIATAPPPVGVPTPTLPSSGADAVTVIGIEFAFDPDDLILSPGAEITLDNQGQVIHNLEIEGVEGFTIEAAAGQTASAAITASPGEYTIFCSIPGHREAGMVGTLTVATG